MSHDTTLHRLIYASRQHIAAGDLEHEVGRIIQVSIRNNRADSITGLLLVHDGWFLQALEGPEARVMAAYRRICADPRHGSARVLTAGPATRREFGDWNMCARGMSPADDAIVDAFRRRGRPDIENLSGARALRLLKAVRVVQKQTEPLALA